MQYLNSSSLSTSSVIGIYHHYVYYDQGETTQGRRDTHSWIHCSLQTRVWWLGDDPNRQLSSGLHDWKSLVWNSLSTLRQSLQRVYLPVKPELFLCDFLK